MLSTSTVTCQMNIPTQHAYVQRAVLERLTGLMMTPVGEAVPAAIVAIETMRLIIELLGEVSSEEVEHMKQPCLTKLTSHTRPIRAQVNIHVPDSQCVTTVLVP